MQSPQRTAQSMHTSSFLDPKNTVSIARAVSKKNIFRECFILPVLILFFQIGVPYFSYFIEKNFLQGLGVTYILIGVSVIGIPFYLISKVIVEYELLKSTNLIF